MVIKGVVKIIETIIDYAEKEYYSKAAIQKNLMELNILYEDGKISKREYNKAQEQLIERLLEANKKQNDE
ncbi:MAG: hypothetical protein A2Y24_01715 [Clostridiales bacterium GWE2_32_10]|nr:MAG: hypothetical protein A2X02_04705 [Bacteroidetes bacterium GWF2_29_10]OGO87165.1 MAG: hypothetical protein A2Y24_01715 [Clostridiales bacterium GWE2_32_10]HBY19675.1 hypothetical protein [Clostridiales bacterium]